MRLANKVAIVTGGSQGIGEAIAKSYASEGAKVAILNRNSEKATRVVKEIEAAQKRIETRISTREEERQRLLGCSWEAIVPQMIKEEKLLAGLPSAAPAVVKQPPVPPANDDGDLEEE
jgi:NAD(P)-dependent dehydrogenase (short-subunit alcohol dehydrogenase family)